MTTRYQTPDLRDANGNRIVPRTLLQEEIASASASVLLTLPATPWTRFTIEIDDWSSTGNLKNGQIRFGIAGGVREGGTDYDWTLNQSSSNDNGGSFEDVDDDGIRLNGQNDNMRFGSEPEESMSYHIHIDPGENGNHLPRAWFTGAGFGAANRSTRVAGGGVYTGDTTSLFGRAESVEFAFSDGDPILRGKFRLYGTE